MGTMDMDSVPPATITGAERGDARDVHALFAFGHGAAENHVVNFLGVEARDARERFLDGESGEIVGARGAERTFVGAPDGSADGRDNDGFGHGGTSELQTRKSKSETRKAKGIGAGTTGSLLGEWKEIATLAPTDDGACLPPPKNRKKGLDISLICAIFDLVDNYA